MTLRLLFSKAAFMLLELSQYARTLKYNVITCRELPRARNFEYGLQMKVLQVKIEPMKIKNALKGFNKWKEGIVLRVRLFVVVDVSLSLCLCFCCFLLLLLLFSVVVVVKDNSLCY